MRMMKYVFYFLISLLFVSCAVGDGDEMSLGTLESAHLSPGYYGRFEGIWSINGQNIGSAELEMGVQQVYSTLPLAPDVQQAIARKLGVEALDDVRSGSYSVSYLKTAYSASSCYFTLLPDDVEITVKAKGHTHKVQLVMELDNDKAVYDKQTTAFVAFLHLAEVRLDGELLREYKPSQTIQFKSTKKTRTSGD